MIAAQRVDVLRIAAEVGIPADLFLGWEGHELALYQDTSGRSASLEIARKEAQRKVALREWTLDLGNRAVGLPRERAREALMRLENVVPVPVSEVERIHEEALERGGAAGVLD